MRHFLMLAAFAAILFTLKILATAAVDIAGPWFALTIICACVAIARYIEPPTAASSTPPARPQTAESCWERPHAEAAPRRIAG